MSVELSYYNMERNSLFPDFEQVVDHDINIYRDILSTPTKTSTKKAVIIRWCTHCFVHWITIQFNIDWHLIDVCKYVWDSYEGRCTSR